MADMIWFETATNKAFAGVGVDEKAIISFLGESNPEYREMFRKGCNSFIDDQRDDHLMKFLKHEFMRFKNAVVLWIMYPWERDARLINQALEKGPQSYGVIVEVACTRSANEFVEARNAYHSLFHRSIEADVDSHVDSSRRKLLVALVNAHRYEGPRVEDESAKMDAQNLHLAITNADQSNLINDETVVRILSKTSKAHLKAVCRHYSDMCGRNMDEDLSADPILLAAVQCLCTPLTYFSKVLNAAMTDHDKKVKKALTRVIVTQADGNMWGINEEFQKLYGVSLSQKIEVTAKGSYKDLLLTLIARSVGVLIC